MDDPDYVSDATTGSDPDVTRPYFQTTEDLGEPLIQEGWDVFEAEENRGTAYQREYPLHDPNGREVLICISQEDLNAAVFEINRYEPSECLGTWAPRDLPSDPDQAFDFLSASFFNFIGHIEAYFEGRATSIPVSIDGVWCRTVELASDDMDE